jgi:uncharacterized protein YjbI with pentapeptide repeats
MADKALEALLKSGASAWNAWRAAHLDVTPDLSAAHLCGVDLMGADLAGADLRKADLRGADLSDAILTNARLDGADFFRTVLDNADLAGAHVVGARFLTESQLKTSRNWQSAYRDPELGCGAPVPR